jgi:hypothetical protein
MNKLFVLILMLYFELKSFDRYHGIFNRIVFILYTVNFHLKGHALIMAEPVIRTFAYTLSKNLTRV